MRFRALLALVLVSLTGCERVIDITLPSSTPRLVVEARLERVRGAVNGNQSIQLTISDSYFSRSAPTPVLDAIVRVVDSTGRVFPFVASGVKPGVYETSALSIERGRGYTLRITWRGDEYASTERVAAAVPIARLFFTAAESQSIVGVGPPASGGGLRASIDFTDPKGVANFYLWDQFIDGQRIVATDTTQFGFYRAVASDEFFDGVSVETFQPYGGVRVRSGQRVVLRQIAISAQAYRFYYTLSSQAINNGSPFSVPPTSVRGNVANETTPSRLALGYFMVSEVSQAQLLVP